MRFLAILPPLAMAIFALCHPTGVHVTRPKMPRLTNGFGGCTSSLAGRAPRGVRHYSILFYSTKLVPPLDFAPGTSNTINCVCGLIISLVVLTVHVRVMY